MDTLSIHDTFDPYVSGRRPFEQTALEPVKPQPPVDGAAAPRAASGAASGTVPKRPAGIIGPRSVREGAV